ncbi:hypothetical protein P775_15320 [Puniceibacterium antarcticum]|uniref:Uncharacterized protein n=2 Tax=Puniceibacterium antarcticum TaxID=1206336 RepID=A0A2G8RCJ4_9RHOB|nr:hypothetical protein P775_15320 [Puniceibacterium antarcticum]
MNGILSDNGGEWYLGKRSFADTFLYVLTRWIARACGGLHQMRSPSHCI